MLHKRQMLILSKLLDSSGPLTSKQLALLASVSVRTIKEDIASLNQSLLKYNTHIQSKPGEGYRLVIENEADEQMILKLCDNSIIKQFDVTPSYNYERVNYIIKKLLVVDYHIKLEDLMDELYVSRSTMTGDLKEVRKILQYYRLKVTSKANYGIRIEGSEIDKRLCIAEYFYHYNKDYQYSIDTPQMFSGKNSQQEYRTIIAYIQQVCGTHEILLPDYSINNFAIHIIISMRRCLFYNYVQVEDDVVAYMEHTAEFAAAKELTELLQQHCGFLLPVGETVYLCMHLQSKCTASQTAMDEQAKATISECLSVIYQEVQNNFGIELDQDKELYNYLFLHIPQMVTRLKNHMVIRNPLAAENIRRYLFATKVTHSAAAIIELFYRVKIDQNEFGYLMLYFNLALCKYIGRKKIRLGLVSGRGRPEAIMYFNEIKEHFNPMKYEIVLLDNIAPKLDSIDLLVSTYRLAEPVDIPTITVENDRYLDNIRTAVNNLQINQLDFRKYFKPEYCDFNMKGSTQEEVWNHMHKRFVELKFLDEIPSDLQRFISNELGNGIVHFQDLHRICRKSFCFIGVLKRPVLWNHQIIRILVMIKTKRDGDKDLYALCDIISRWANNSRIVEAFLENPCYEAFLDGIMNL